MVPEGWSRQTVGNVFEVQLGKMLNKAAKEKGPQSPYLTNFNVRWGAFNINKLNSMFFSEKDREKFVLKAGADSDEFVHSFQRKPATDSEVIRPSLGAQRRWCFVSTRSGRFGQCWQPVFALNLLSD